MPARAEELQRNLLIELVVFDEQDARSLKPRERRARVRPRR